MPKTKQLSKNKQIIIMDDRKLLEEQLREAACIGDTDAVQELIDLGVDVNARHAINGWTPLHWACKRNFLDVVVLLLRSGADKNVKSEKGETPASVCSNHHILQLLGAPVDLPKISNNSKNSGFVPNYLKNQEYSYQEKNPFYVEETVLKVRIANLEDPDFIEIDLPSTCITYEELLKVCCQELNVNSSQVLKLRKLPNTKLRRDKDVQRLENNEELELVLFSNSEVTGKVANNANGNTMPLTPTNNYQSISKKDQTILY